MTSVTPEPGWYFDPDGCDGERFWNGDSWTEHRRSTRPVESSATDVPPNAKVPPVTTVKSEPEPEPDPGPNPPPDTLGRVGNSDPAPPKNGPKIGDWVGGLFGRSARQPTPAGPQRGSDLETETELSFREAINGVTMPLRLTLSTTCVDCDGSGLIARKPCTECSGTGATPRPRTINMRLPPGIKDGQRVRLARQGASGLRGAPPGDLYVTVHVKPDTVFGRDGDDLTVSVPISFGELVSGTTLAVPILDGVVGIRVPAGTPDGRVLRVRGRGGPRRSGGHGDLMVTVKAGVPPGFIGEGPITTGEAPRCRWVWR